MKLFPILLLFCLVLLFEPKLKLCLEVDSENVMIETTDITVEFKKDGKINLMEAYRSTKNDLILKANKSDEFGQLEWHSIGSPSLANIPSKSFSLSFASIFQSTPNGFNIYIDMLSDIQKGAFIKKIKSKYRVDVETSQIVKLKPSKLQCTIEQICDHKEYLLNGSLKTFVDFPLKVEFKFLNASIKECFEHYLIEHQHIEIVCKVSKNSKSLKQNYFSLSAEQMSNNEILDKLFGDANEVYVDRSQMANLASEIYSSYNVYEEYEIPEKEFSSSFIEDLVKQTSADFKPVPFTTALKSLSKYSKKDLTPSQIKSVYENSLKVRTSGERKFLAVNKRLDNNGSDSVNSNHSASISGKDIFSMIGIDLSYNYVNEKEKNWAFSNTSLENQTNELNSHTRDQIEWKIDGTRLIPKSLKLGKLVKSRFKKGLRFERIRRLVANTIVSKSFQLEYKDGNNQFSLQKIII